MRCMIIATILVATAGMKMQGFPFSSSGNKECILPKDCVVIHVWRDGDAGCHFPMCYGLSPYNCGASCEDLETLHHRIGHGPEEVNGLVIHGGRTLGKLAMSYPSVHHNSIVERNQGVEDREFDEYMVYTQFYNWWKRIPSNRMALAVPKPDEKFDKIARDNFYDMGKGSLLIPVQVVYSKKGYEPSKKAKLCEWCSYGPIA